MITPRNFQSKHYMVLPGSDFRSTSELNFIINLSGVAVLENFKGLADGNWRKEVVYLKGDSMGMDRVLTRIHSLLPSLPARRADGSLASWAFVPLQWTIYASFNSIFNSGNSVNAGYEIDDWKIERIDKESISTAKIKAFEGMKVDLSVRDRDGQINKIGYEINMHGYYAVQWDEVD